MGRHPTRPWAWGQGCGSEGPMSPGLESLFQVCRVAGPEKAPVDPSSGIVTPSLPPSHHRLHTWRGGCTCESTQPSLASARLPAPAPSPLCFHTSLPSPSHSPPPLFSPLFSSPTAFISPLFPSFPSSLHSPHLLSPSSSDPKAGR